MQAEQGLHPSMAHRPSNQAAPVAIFLGGLKHSRTKGLLSSPQRSQQPRAHPEPQLVC